MIVAIAGCIITAFSVGFLFGAFWASKERIPDDPQA